MQRKDIYDFNIRNQSIRQKSLVVNFPVITRRIVPGEQNPRIWHQHDCLEIAIVISGTAVHILDNRSAPIREGDVLLIGPNLVHGYEECADLGLYNLLYKPNKLPIPILDGTDIPMFQRFLSSDFAMPSEDFTPQPVAHFPNREALDDAVRQMDRIHQELTVALPGNMFVGFIYLMDFLATILRLCGTDESVSKPVQQWIFPMEDILSFLNKNFAKRISLDQLAKMSNLSRRSFQYKFKRLTGRTLTDYLLRKRLAQAKVKLLKEPNEGIPAIAFDCGFEDPGYFTRQFRKAFGVPPGKFRQDSAKAQGI